MHEEAILEFENACACSGGRPIALATLAHAHAQAGHHDQARGALHELELVAKARYVSPYWISMVHCGLVQDDLAFEWLGRAIAERDVWLIWLNVEPRFDRL